MTIQNLMGISIKLWQNATGTGQGHKMSDVRSLMAEGREKIYNRYMELTEEQKKISNSQKFWEMQEETRKQVELWQQQPMTLEEANQMMESREAFQKKNSSMTSKEN